MRDAVRTISHERTRAFPVVKGHWFKMMSQQVRGFRTRSKLTRMTFTFSSGSEVVNLMVHDHLSSYGMVGV